MSQQRSVDDSVVGTSSRRTAGPHSPSNAIRMLRQASSRRFMREPSLRVREAAEEQVEQRQSELAYSWPVVILDIVWNAGFVVATLIVLGLSLKERPSAPLRLWVLGYAAQCCVHMVCVWLEYKRRQQVRDSGEENSDGPSHGGSAGRATAEASLSQALLRQRSEQSQGGDGQSRGRDEEEGAAQEGAEQGTEDATNTQGNDNGVSDDADASIWDRSLARQIESVNTMFSFVWWIVGLGWLISTFDDTFQDSPMLSWLCMIFLAFDVFFVIFCTALACVIGIAVCCCLPCIIAVLYAVGDKDGATPEAIESLPRFKFRRVPSSSSSQKSEAKLGELTVVVEQQRQPLLSQQHGGVIVPVDDGTGAHERLVAAEDAECCICLSSYDDGAFLRELPCGHHFDQSCLDKWLRTKPTCPLCKYDIVRKCRPGGGAQVAPPTVFPEVQSIVEAPRIQTSVPASPLISSVDAAGFFDSEPSTQS